MCGHRGQSGAELHPTSVFGTYSQNHGLLFRALMPDRLILPYVFASGIAAARCRSLNVFVSPLGNLS